MVDFTAVFWLELLLGYTIAFLPRRGIIPADCHGRVRLCAAARGGSGCGARARRLRGSGSLVRVSTSRARGSALARLI